MIALRTLILLGILSVLSVVDARERRIPNVFILSLIACDWCALLFVYESFQQWFRVVYMLALQGAATLIMLVIICDLAKRFGLPGSFGGGDIKLISALSGIQGIEGMMETLFLACVLALIVSVVHRRFVRGGFPFAPFLTTGCAVSVLFGQGFV